MYRPIGLYPYCRLATSQGKEYGSARCARQQQDGSVCLPEALVPYVGKETLHPAK